MTTATLRACVEAALKDSIEVMSHPLVGHALVELARIATIAIEEIERLNEEVVNDDPDEEQQ